MIPKNCQINLSSYELEYLDQFTTIESDLSDIVTKAHKLDRFGKKDKAFTKWIDAHDYLSLMLYLTITRLRIDRDIYNCDTKTPTEYYELYSIQCLVDKFNCKGINIVPILKVFFLDRERIGKSGIGRDHIEIGCPIQQVQ